MPSSPTSPTDLRGATAVSAYLLGVAALIFAATVLGVAEMNHARAALLSPPLAAVGAQGTLWQAFWVSLLYFPLMLGPLLLYALTRRGCWLVVQAAAAAVHGLTLLAVA